jgi:hypothetical protein
MSRPNNIAQRNKNAKRLGLPPIVPVGYFKRIQGRRHCKEIISFMKVMTDGRIYTVNVTEMKTSTIATFGSTPMTLYPSTESAWKSAYTKLMKHLNKF